MNEICGEDACLPRIVHSDPGTDIHFVTSSNDRRPEPAPASAGKSYPSLFIIKYGTVPRRTLAHMIHERFYCNRRYAAATSLAASFARPAGGLAPRDLDILFQVCLGPSGLHAPVSLGVLAVSSRIVMNHVG